MSAQAITNTARPAPANRLAVELRARHDGSHSAAFRDAIAAALALDIYRTRATGLLRAILRLHDSGVFDADALREIADEVRAVADEIDEDADDTEGYRG